MTEQEIIKGCVQENVTCQRLLFEQYSGILMTVCLRYSSTQAEAEDVMQEAFIRIFAYIHQFKSEGSFEGWLKRIVANTALRILQKKGIRFAELNEDTQEQYTADTDAWSQANEAAILQLIRNLPAGYRTVFNMYVMEGYSHEEIAAMLKINIGTSRSQLAKARKILQQQIISQEKFRLNG